MNTDPGLENVRADQLASGVTVITERMPHVRSVTTGIWVKAGSRFEVGTENGISHFIEHMLFKGTKSRSAEDIARQMDSLGGNIDAFTSKELVCFNSKMLDQHLPIAFDILADMVLNPLFAEEDIEKEKGVILEELKMEMDTPEYLVHDLFTSSFWKGHSLGKPILGTKGSIRRFTPASVQDYYARNYMAPNTVITAAGNLRHEDLMRLVEERFGHLPASQPRPDSATPSANAEIICRNKRSLEQVQICLGVPCCELPNMARFPLFVLNTILGGGMSSRLFQNIREKRGLAYSVASEPFMYHDTGCLSVFAGTSRAAIAEVLQLVLTEFRAMKESPVVPEELQRAKDHLKGSFMLGLESTSSRMSHLARQHIYFGRFSSMDEIVQEVESVTAADVQSLANEFFRPERIALTVLGNLNGFTVSRDDLRC